MKHNRYGSHDDYCREIDDEAEKRAHDEDQCEGAPFCVYCQDELEELRAEQHHECYEENRRLRIERKS